MPPVLRPCLRHASHTCLVQGLDSRPRTPLTRPTSAASPNRPGTASSNASSRDSVSCDPRSVVQSVHSKLNVFDIDAIRLQLQQALQDEHAALLDDIQYLSALLEGETDLQVRIRTPIDTAYAGSWAVHVAGLVLWPLRVHLLV